MSLWKQQVLKNKPFVKPFYQEGVGRRTGAVLKTNVRKDSDGFEIFDDYFSESEGDSTDFSFGINKENISLNSTRVGGRGRGKSTTNSKKKSSPLRSMKSFSPVVPSENSLRYSTSSQEKTCGSCSGAVQNGPYRVAEQNGGVEPEVTAAEEGAERKDETAGVVIIGQMSPGEEELQAGSAEDGEVVSGQDDAVSTGERGEIGSEGESMVQTTSERDGEIVKFKAERSDRNRSRIVSDSKHTLPDVTSMSEGEKTRTESSDEAEVMTGTQASAGPEEAEESGDEDSSGESGDNNKDVVVYSQGEDSSLPKETLSERSEEDDGWILEGEEEDVEEPNTLMKDTTSKLGKEDGTGTSDEDGKDVDGRGTTKNTASKLIKGDCIGTSDEDKKDLDASADGSDEDENDEDADAESVENVEVPSQGEHGALIKDTESMSVEDNGTGTSGEDDKDISEQGTLKRIITSMTGDLKSGQDSGENHLEGQGVGATKTATVMASGRKNDRESIRNTRKRIQSGHQIVDSPLQTQIFPLTKKRLSFSAAAADEGKHLQETTKIVPENSQPSKIVGEEDKAATSFLNMMKRQSGKVFSFRFSELLSSTALPDKTQLDGAAENDIVILSEGSEKSFMAGKKRKSTARKSKKSKVSPQVPDDVSGETILRGPEKTQVPQNNGDKTVVSVREFSENEKTETFEEKSGDDIVEQVSTSEDKKKDTKHKKRTLNASMTTKKSKQHKSNKANKTLGTTGTLHESQVSHETELPEKKRTESKAMKDKSTAKKVQDSRSKKADRSLQGDKTDRGPSSGEEIIEGNNQAETIGKDTKASEVPQEQVAKLREQHQDERHLESEVSQGSIAETQGRKRRKSRAPKKKLQESDHDNFGEGEQNSSNGEDLQVTRRKSNGDVLKNKSEQNTDVDRRKSEGEPLKKQRGHSKRGDHSIVGRKQTRAATGTKRSKRMASQNCEYSDRNSKSESDTGRGGKRRQSNRRKSKKAASEVPEGDHLMTENHGDGVSSIVEVADDIVFNAPQSEAAVVDSESSSTQHEGEKGNTAREGTRKQDSRKRTGGSLADLSTDVTAGEKKLKHSETSASHNDDDQDDDENSISPRILYKGKKSATTKRRRVTGKIQSESDTGRGGNQRQSNRRKSKKVASEEPEENHLITENHGDGVTSIVEVADDIVFNASQSEAAMVDSDSSSTQHKEEKENTARESTRKQDSRKRTGGSSADLFTASGTSVSHNDDDQDDEGNLISPEDLRSRLSKRWGTDEKSRTVLASPSVAEESMEENIGEVLLKSGKVTRTRAKQRTGTDTISTATESDLPSGIHGKKPTDTKTRRRAKRKTSGKNVGKHVSSSSDIRMTECTVGQEKETGDRNGQMKRGKTAKRSLLMAEDDHDGQQTDGSTSGNVTVIGKGTTRSSLRSSSTSNDDADDDQITDVQSQRSGPRNDSISSKWSLKKEKNSSSRDAGDHDKDTGKAGRGEDQLSDGGSKGRSLRRKSTNEEINGKGEESSDQVVIVEVVPEMNEEVDQPCKLSIVEEAEENADVTVVSLDATDHASNRESLRESSSTPRKSEEESGSVTKVKDVIKVTAASPVKVSSADDAEGQESQDGAISGASSIVALPSDTHQNDDLSTDDTAGDGDSQDSSDSDTIRAESEGSGSQSTPTGSGEADNPQLPGPSSIFKGTKAFKKYRRSRKNKKFRFSLFDLPKPKAWIIPPEDGGQTVRRSRRNRVRPLEWWRNERPVYERRKSGGFALQGIDSPEEREPYQRRNNSRRQQQRKRTVPITPKNLTAHCTPPEDAEPGCSEPVVVVNPETQREVLVDAMRTPDSFRYVGPRGEEPKGTDDFIVTKTLLQQAFNAGSLTLRPEGEKGLQLLEYDTMVFYVVRGKLAVTIHKTTRIIESGSYFFVPQGNVYNIINLRKDEAKLVFFQHKGLSGESFSQLNI